ncbi:NosD domain-containing protein [Candidatus Lokiarchaeum ossiferum]
MVKEVMLTFKLGYPRKQLFNIILCVFFAIFTVGFYSDLNQVNGIVEKSTTSPILHSKIHIIGNEGWSEFKSAGNCTGSGTEADPYLLADCTIDGGNNGTIILLENSTVFFKIENITFQNGGSSYRDAGIQMFHVNNAIIKNNRFFNFSFGIYAQYSNDTLIVGNEFLGEHGISLEYCFETMIYFNTFNTNRFFIFSLKHHSLTHQMSKEEFDYSYGGQNFTSRLGNYYSSEPNTDRDNDGIGESSMVYKDEHDGYIEYADDFCLVKPISYYTLYGPAAKSIPGFSVFQILELLALTTILSVNSKTKFAVKTRIDRIEQKEM